MSTSESANRRIDLESLDLSSSVRKAVDILPEGKDDLLGRDAFAQFLAEQIRTIRRDIVKDFATVNRLI